MWFHMRRWPLLVLRRGHLIPARCVFSESGVWAKKMSPELRDAVEQFWDAEVRRTDSPQRMKEDASAADEKRVFYVLAMFPYPSGRLHMGHMRVYTVSDVLARFFRMTGKRVVHPIGWDAFGLPAENAAIERGVRPDAWTKGNIASMKKQLMDFGFSFDWDREVSTCHPGYYRWTQHLFLRMFEQGLVYQKEDLVNWDPLDQTVLADEQVDQEGRAWRSGAQVEKRYLKQWFVRTTAFSQPLYNGLETLDQDAWRTVIGLQRAWIGECDGHLFELRLSSETEKKKLWVWTSTPELWFGAAFVTVPPEQAAFLSPKDAPLVQGEGIEVRLSVNVTNPLSGEPIPVFAADTLPCARATDSRLGIPCINADDAAFCQRHGIPIKNVRERKGSQDVVVDSAQFSGMDLSSARSAVLDRMRSLGIRCYPSSSVLKDWLISRQRYWGTPIPIIHCPNCKAVPVPDADLPVTLPHLETFSGKGASPLLQAHDWLQVSCPRCGCTDAKRETDTMDTFFDSAWYYLRYLDPRNEGEMVSPEEVGAAMPVDIYVGGREHATMHLYYARFVAHFLQSKGLLREPEPFRRLLGLGFVKSPAFKVKGTGKYLHKEEVDLTCRNKPVEKASGRPVDVKWEKMSKSKHNGVDPQEVVKQLGRDMTRLLVIKGGPLVDDCNWTSEAPPDLVQWRFRLWSLVGAFIEAKTASKPVDDKICKFHEDRLRFWRNEFLLRVTDQYANGQLAGVVHTLMEMTKVLWTTPKVFACGASYERALGASIVASAPVMPYFACELWSGFASNANGEVLSQDGWGQASVFCQPWPIVDDEFPLRLVAVVNGSEKGDAFLSSHQLDAMTEEQIVSAANSAASKALKGTEIVAAQCSRGKTTITVRFTTKKHKNKNHLLSS